MSPLPELVVLLWTLPVFLCILLPLLILALWLLLRALQYLSPAPGLIHPALQRLQKLTRSDRQKMRREERKTPTAGLRADISDTTSSFTALVANLSDSGICLHHVPEQLSCSRKLLSIVVHTARERYRLVARPCWELPLAKGKVVGAEIARAPSDWSRFVLSCQR